MKCFCGNEAGKTNKGTPRVYCSRKCQTDDYRQSGRRLAHLALARKRNIPKLKVVAANQDPRSEREIRVLIENQTYKDRIQEGSDAKGGAPSSWNG